MAPSVSVVMSVYNGMTYVQEAVDSILGQSYTDYEFIVVDDGSTDGTGEFLHGQADPRIHVLQKSENWGLTRSLNLGLSAARGKYVARMDADDVARTDRLAEQVQFLERNEQIGIVGSAIQVINETGAIREDIRAPATDLEIRWTMLLNNPYWHPTVLVRSSILERFQLRYDETYATAQDYELWTRLLIHTKGANLPEPLVKYRRQGGITAERRDEQLANHDRIAYRTIRQNFPDLPVTAEEAKRLRALLIGVSDAETIPALNEQRSLLALYYRLNCAFVAEHTGQPGLDRLRERVLMQIMQQALNQPLSSSNLMYWLRLAMESATCGKMLVNEMGKRVRNKLGGSS